MGDIYLDKEDVRAIVEQRDFDVPERTRNQKVTEWGTAILAVIFLATSIAIQQTEGSGGEIFFIASVAVGIIFYYTHWKNNEPFRKAMAAFVEHWEKTGEIKPRWPGRLKKNEKDYNPPRRGNYTSPH